MNKNRRVINIITILGLIVYVGLSIFYLKTTNDFPKDYRQYELDTITKIDTEIRALLESEPQDISKLQNLVDYYPMDLYIEKEGSPLYQSKTGLNNENFFNFVNDEAALFESGGTYINPQGNHFLVDLRVYHFPTHLITPFIMKQFFILALCFTALIFCLFMIVRFTIAPLIAVKTSLELMKEYNFEDAALSNTSRDAINKSLRDVSSRINTNLDLISRDYSRYEQALANKSQKLNNTVLITKSFIHDLKTPLIHQIYENELMIETNPELKDLALSNIRHNKRVLNQVNDILSIINRDNSLEASQTNTEKIDITQLITSVIREFRIEIQRKSLDVEIMIDQNVSIERNPIVLRLLIHNIVSNMIKYALDESTVQVSARDINHTVSLSFKNETSELNRKRMIASGNVFNSLDEDSEHEFSSGQGLFLIKDLTDISQGTYSLNTDDKFITIQLEYK